MKLGRALLLMGGVTLVALVAGPVSSAYADGIERPRTVRAAPKPSRARPAPPPAIVAPAPAPERVYTPPPPAPSNEIVLSDGFFSGPLSGGVGYAYGAGGAPGGGAFYGRGADPRFSGVTDGSDVGFGGGFTGGGFSVGRFSGATVSSGFGGGGCA